MLAKKKTDVDAVASGALDVSSRPDHRRLGAIMDGVSASSPPSSRTRSTSNDFVMISDSPKQHVVVSNNCASKDFVMLMESPVSHRRLLR